MTLVAAQLIAKVSADTKDAEQGLKNVGDNAKTSKGGISGLLGTIAGFAAGGAVATGVGDAFSFLNDQIFDTVTAGEEAQKTESQTAAALKSTHDASGETADAISGLAEKYMGLTGIQSDTIQGAENILLTFTNIHSSVFPQTTQAVLDMATAMHMDLNQAALQVGKALDDPVKGMTALQREGVTFTAAQKQAVKQMEATGNMAGAQKIILAELSKEFGGSAEAAGQTFAGQLQIAQSRLEDTKEKIGKALLPVLQELAGAVLPVVSGAGEQFADVLSKVAAFVTGQVVPALHNLRPVVQDIMGGIKELTSHADIMKAILIGVGVAIAAAVIPALVGLAGAELAALGPIIAAAAPFILLGAAVAGLVLLFKHAMDTSAPFRAAMQQVVSVAQQLWSEFAAHALPILQAVAQFLGSHLAQAFQIILPKIEEAATTVGIFAGQLATRLGPALTNVFHFIQFALGILQSVWNAVWPGMQNVLMGVWNIIQGVIQTAWSLISGIIKVGLDILGGNWGQAWHDIQDTLRGVWDGITKILGGAIQVIIGIVQGLIGGIIGLFTGLWDKLTGHSIIPDMIRDILGFFGGLPGKVIGFLVNLVISAIEKFAALRDMAVALVLDLVSKALSFIGSLPGKFASIGTNIIQSLADAVKNGASHFVGNLKNMAQDALNGVKGIFGIHSPSKEFADIGQNLGLGLIGGIQSVNVAKAVADHVKAAIPQAKAALGINVSGGPAAVGAGLTNIAAGNTATQIAQAVSAAQSSATAAGAGTPLILQVDGHTFARLILPYQVGQIRQQIGIRSM